jgi:hypothetical protein
MRTGEFIIGVGLVAGFTMAVSAEETGAATAGARESVTRATAALQERSGEEEPRWFVPPIRQRKVVDHKEERIPASRKTIEVPVYEYETVEVWRDVREGDSATAMTRREKVKVNRPVRQTGTRKEERLVPDPNGTESLTRSTPIYGPGGPDFWPFARFGLNGLVLYAQHRAGVDPAEPSRQSVEQGLASLVHSYGLPDSTWDLAGIVIGLAHAKDAPTRQVAQRAAGKLLDGQIAEGPAAGLWGPVCINTKLYALALEERTRLSELYTPSKPERNKGKSLADAKETKEQKSKRTLEAEAALQALHDLLRDIAQCNQSPRGHAYTLGTDGTDDKITVPGLPHYVFNQTSADLEHTALAVVALRVAAEANVLPRQPARPAGKPWQQIPAPTAEMVLSRTLKAICTAQQADGRWSELNLHQPVTDFQRVVGLPGIPPKPATFVALPSPVTVASTLQGYATLHHLGWLLRATDTLAARRQLAEKALAETIEKLGTANAPALGSPASPYEAALWLHNIPWRGGGDENNTWRRRFTEWLLAQQGQDGLWMAGNRSVRLYPTSLRERMKLLPVALPGAGHRTNEFDYAQAHVPINTDNRFGNALHQRHNCDPHVLPTAYALCFLSGVQP